jgi:NADH-quinone oxidoreductase subunit M
MFQVNWLFATVALVSLVVSVVYATRLIGGIVFGEPKPETTVTHDLERHEIWAVAVLGLATLVFGLFPQLLLDLLRGPIDAALLPLLLVEP